MDVSTLPIERGGFVELRRPKALQEAVSLAMQNWELFCGLPERIKKAFGTGDRIVDGGYSLRNGPRDDAKEFFHISKGELPSFVDIAKRSNNPTVLDFLLSTGNLQELIEPMILDFAKAVETEYSVCDFANAVRENRGKWTFRFLHYFGGDVLALPHVDRGNGFTLHLYESHGGGMYMDQYHNWKPLTVDDETTIIFSGIGLQDRSKGQLTGLNHKVIGVSDAVKEGRYALVAFIDVAGTHCFDDSRYRMQDLPDGWNYMISHEDLQAYFTRRE